MRSQQPPGMLIRPKNTAIHPGQRTAPWPKAHSASASTGCGAPYWPADFKNAPKRELVRKKEKRVKDRNMTSKLPTAVSAYNRSSINTEYPQWSSHHLGPLKGGSPEH